MTFIGLHGPIEVVYVVPPSRCELARLFADDPELRRWARAFADAHALAISGTVPRSIRRQLAPIVDQLEQVMRGPHLRDCRRSAA